MTYNKTFRPRCPIHGIPDCSPLLNGCSIPNRLHDAYEQGWNDANANFNGVREIAKTAWIRGHYMALNPQDPTNSSQNYFSEWFDEYMQNRLNGTID